MTTNAGGEFISQWIRMYCCRLCRIWPHIGRYSYEAMTSIPNFDCGSCVRCPRVCCIAVVWIHWQTYVQARWDPCWSNWWKSRAIANWSTSNFTVRTVHSVSRLWLPLLWDGKASTCNVTDSFKFFRVLNYVTVCEPEDRYLIPIFSFLYWWRFR